MDVFIYLQDMNEIHIYGILLYSYAKISYYKETGEGMVVRRIEMLFNQIRQEPGALHCKKNIAHYYSIKLMKYTLNIKINKIA